MFAGTRSSHASTTGVAALVVALTLTLAGCSGGDHASTADGSSHSDAAAQSASAGRLTIDEPWAKAASTGEMTAVFGTVHATNGSAHIVGAESDAAAHVELHETVNGAMQPREGGFEIGADGLQFAPGGDHIMLMGLTRDLEPGQEIAVTLVFDDGEKQTFTAPVRQFAGAQENYTDASPSASAHVHNG